MTISTGSPISVPSETNILQNFSDATAGRSQQLYYGVQTSDSVGTDYVLVRDSGTSLPVSIIGGSFDVDFDITINKPTIFAGIAHIDCRYGVTNWSGGTNTCYIVFKVYHYDGSTETQIGTVTTSTVSAGANDQKITKLQLQISRKLFGVGHILRLNADATFTGTGGSILQTDPKTANQELKLWMPVVNLE